MTVTVLSGPERRRRWTTAEKLRLVEETQKAAANIAEIARRHDVHPNLLHLWRRQVRLGVLGDCLKTASGEEVCFAPVAIAQERSIGEAEVTSSNSGVIEIEFVGGGRMRITGPVEHSLVSALMKGLVRGKRRR